MFGFAGHLFLGGVAGAEGHGDELAHFATRDPGDKKGAGSDWVDIAPGVGGWYTFGCEWTPDAIRFIVDGTRYFEVRGHKIHEPMYLLANLALGSHDAGWIPDPDASTPLPARFEIDYVRVFSRD